MLALKSPSELIQFTFSLVIVDVVVILVVVILVVVVVVAVLVVVTDVALSHYINFINMNLM